MDLPLCTLPLYSFQFVSIIYSGLAVLLLVELKHKLPTYLPLLFATKYLRLEDLYLYTDTATLSSICTVDYYYYYSYNNGHPCCSLDSRCIGIVVTGTIIIIINLRSLSTLNWICCWADLTNCYWSSGSVLCLSSFAYYTGTYYIVVVHPSQVHEEVEVLCNTLRVARPLSLSLSLCLLCQPESHLLYSSSVSTTARTNSFFIPSPSIYPSKGS